MYDISAPIEKVINDNRVVNRFLKLGYRTYNDVKDLSLDELLSMQGLGDVSARKAFLDIEDFKKSLYRVVSDKAVELADKIGVEKVLEILEKADSVEK